MAVEREPVTLWLPVTLRLPVWLMDGVHETMEQRTGRLDDWELEEALQEHVERFLARLDSSGPYGPEADDLADALRAVRRIGRRKRVG